MGAFKNLTGERVGRLTVVTSERRRVGKRERIYWICRCDCGNETSVEASNLTTGHAKSCGCLQSESRHWHTRRHGLSKTQTYKIWKSIRKRCNDRNNKSFKDYGARGISLCARWNDYANFLADMGECPEGHSIDRIDNSRGYSPDNCRWTTKVVQANNTRSNKRITYNGITRTVSEWAAAYGVDYHTFWQRLYRLKWPMERALTK